MVKSLSQSLIRVSRADLAAYCLQLGCLEPKNLVEALSCHACGSSLLLRDRYRAVQLLGAGGSGRTFLAIDELRSGLTCVIKQLPFCQSGQPLAQKLELWRLLGQHPQLPSCLDGFEQAGCWYLIQAYIVGQTLATSLAKNIHFNPADIWQILTNLLPVLEFIHAQGTVHGDLKPENIICRSPITAGLNRVSLDDLVLVDFGSVQLLSTLGGNPAPIVGSPEYAAPEQLEGQPSLGSDLYSLGVICIHLLTGMRPFNLFEVANHRWVWQSYWLTEPSTAKAELENQQLSQFLDRLIAPDLSQRFGSATAAIAALSKISGRKVKPAPSVQSQSPGWTCTATLTGHAGLFANVNAVAIAPDQTLLASASDDKTIRLWDLPTGKAGPVLRGHSQFVRSVAFHPHDRSQLVSGSRDRTLKLWHLPTPTEIQTLSGHQNAVNAVGYAPDGQTIASGSADKTVKLWDAQTGELIASLQGHSLGVSAIAFSPLLTDPDQPPILASASADATVKLWELEPLTCIATLVGHLQAVQAVAFSPDRQWLATGGEDRTIRIWNTSSWGCDRILSGHPWSISSLVFTADSQILLSASWDHAVKLWQVKTGAEIGRLVGHTDVVSDVAIAPDQNLIVTSSHDQTIKLWQRNQEIIQPTRSRWRD